MWRDISREKKKYATTDYFSANTALREKKMVGKLQSSIMSSLAYFA
jgi:hypothetical protein